VDRERVLIIDDSAETQQLLAELVLEPSGHRPIAALDGEEELRLALEELPDLIILDMQLPKMNGLQVLEALQERRVGIPVIFTTVRESPELVVQAFRLGARDYVIKPFDPQEMQEAIRRALTSATLHEEHDHLTEQLVEANERFQRQLQELNAIYAIGRSVTSLLDLNSVLNRVVEAATYLADAEEGMLLLPDQEGSELYLRAAKGVDEKVARSLRVRVDDSLAGRAIQTDRPVLMSGERASERELRWEIPEGLPPVQGNPHRLRQVMDNLLTNALKYTSEGGWIAVNAVDDDGYVVVNVADNGIGIPPAQQPYIFDKFYRVESEETLGIVGSGLGLEIVRAVIEKHNGRVWVESRPGVGSVFSFVLPAVRDKTQQTEET
jgi:signal transduction histidine kinase